MEKISKSFFLNYIKNRKILFFVLFVQLFLILFYIYSSTENILYQDSLHPVNVNLIENLYSGNLSFGDLWQEYNGINIFGGMFLLLINVIIFKLNTRFEMWLSALSMFSVSLLTFEYFKRLLKKFFKMNDNILIQVLFIPITIIYFSLNQWENIVFTGGAVHIISILLFF